MITFTGVHFFKGKGLASSWNSEAEKFFEFAFDMSDAEKEKLEKIKLEVKKFKENDAEEKFKYLKLMEGFASFSLGRVTVNFSADSMAGSVVSPEPLKSWKNNKNKIFLADTISLLSNSAKSKAIDLFVADKLVAGNPAWVYAYLSIGREFYGFNSLPELLKTSSAVDFCNVNYKESDYVEVKNSFFQRRKYLSGKA